jgi:hypothetical protein
VLVVAADQDKGEARSGLWGEVSQGFDRLRGREVCQTRRLISDRSVYGHDGAARFSGALGGLY